MTHLGPVFGCFAEQNMRPEKEYFVSKDNLTALRKPLSFILQAKAFLPFAGELNPKAELYRG